MLCDQCIQLVDTDAVFAGAGAAHLDGPHADAMRNALGLRALRRTGRVVQHQHMEVAVTDMTDDGCQHALAIEVGACLQQAIGKTRNGHAGIGGKRMLARRQCQRRIVGVVPRFP